MADAESYNPWTIVNVVFHHLVEQGYHPVLGEAGNPGEPAAQLLRALGITAVVGGTDERVTEQNRATLAEMLEREFGPRRVSHFETGSGPDHGL
ncbi:hypothetical protein [Kutzneria buriramensis]|uniref:Uncharacterized protein n=1 Tax=Kutzneria buriramensis TaxID=1045776 RepID=A0A3E0I6F8_9PSEU|nr:hypothetical protein [Kutzneria buriramensis]REH54313.1 hypothetical protein BCF44_102545 [Kutzneria buriramensis]